MGVLRRLQTPDSLVLSDTPQYPAACVAPVVGYSPDLRLDASQPNTPELPPPYHKQPASVCLDTSSRHVCCASQSIQYPVRRCAVCVCRVLAVTCRVRVRVRVRVPASVCEVSKRASA